MSSCTWCVLSNLSILYSANTMHYVLLSFKIYCYLLFILVVLKFALKTLNFFFKLRNTECRSNINIRQMHNSGTLIKNLKQQFSVGTSKLHCYQKHSKLSVLSLGSNTSRSKNCLFSIWIWMILFPLLQKQQTTIQQSLL